MILKWKPNRIMRNDFAMIDTNYAHFFCKILEYMKFKQAKYAIVIDCTNDKHFVVNNKRENISSLVQELCKSFAVDVRVYKIDDLSDIEFYITVRQSQIDYVTKILKTKGWYEIFDESLYEEDFDVKSVVINYPKNK